jgi:hypothetical protein
MEEDERASADARLVARTPKRGGRSSDEVAGWGRKITHKIPTIAEMSRLRQKTVRSPGQPSSSRFAGQGLEGSQSPSGVIFTLPASRPGFRDLLADPTDVAQEVHFVARQPGTGKR